MSVAAKIEQVRQLLAKLSDDLTTIQFPSVAERRSALEQLKVLGRNKEYAGPIFDEDGIRTLSRLIDTYDDETAREAMRCLANALLLEPKTRQTLVDQGAGPKIAERLKNENYDDEFLAARILFLMTYDTNLDFDKLVSEHQLADSINAALARHARPYSKQPKAPKDMQLKTLTKGKSAAAPQSQMEQMALPETLKLMFNITHFYPDLAEHFSKSIPNIFKMLVRGGIRNPPLKPPVNYMINALLNLDLEDKKGQQLKWLGMNAVFPTFDRRINAEHLVNILDNAIVAYSESELDAMVSPLLTLIRRIYEIAPEPVKKWMAWLILPAEEERKEVLGKSDTLASRLLRLSTSATSQNLRASISSMMFELSGKDAAQFVQNVGYGFAAGFLASNNIEMPQDALEASASGSSREFPVNPITGQRLDMEAPDTSTPMTQEEKEREAERLFVLFDRLKATGVMNVENPVRQAYESGRIHELPDDSD